MVDIAAEMPEGMHPFAYVFMHPPSNGEDSPPMTFEPDSMNSLGRHLERLGFEQVRESLDRYDPPKSGPIHPHNKGKWTAKTRPEPTVSVDPLAQVKARMAELPPSDRGDYIQELLAEAKAAGVEIEESDGDT